MKPFSEQHELGYMASLKTFDKGCNFFLKKGLLLLSLLLVSGVAAEAVKAAADGPCKGGGRYVDCGNGTVTDTATGLIWLKDANCAIFGLKSWADTITAVADLADGQCGLTDGSSPGDWNLPFIRDWKKFSAKVGSAPFINVQDGSYWSAATYPKAPGTAWALGTPKTTSYNYRDLAYGWPVRGNMPGINKESCKKDGWQKLGFKNQGQCIKALK